jgi:hypothetical protein
LINNFSLFHDFSGREICFSPYVRVCLGAKTVFFFSPLRRELSHAMPQKNVVSDDAQPYNEELLRQAVRAVAREIGLNVTPTVTRAQYETAEKRLRQKVDARMQQLLQGDAS